MSLFTHSEDLLKAAATASGEGFTAARTKIGERLKSARTALANASQPVFDRTRESAAVTDEYVRGNAWTVIGVAIAIGVLIGFLTAKR